MNTEHLPKVLKLLEEIGKEGVGWHEWFKHVPPGTTLNPDDEDHGDGLSNLASPTENTGR